MKFLKFIAFFAATLLLSSCEQNDVELAKDNTTLERTAKSVTYERGELFTYTTDQELADNSSEAFLELSSRDNSEIQAARDFNQIINKVKVSNGKGLLVEKYYINERRGVIVRSLLLNEDGEYTESNEVVPNNNPSSSGGCPMGYNSVGSCAYSLGETLYRDCVRVAVGNYSLQHTATGECTQYMISNSQTSTNICARGCN